MISKIHQHFSERLNDPRVLENPEDFLGENYKEVLNFWLILDELSKEQLRVVEERCLTFCNENRSEWKKAADLTIDASWEVVGENYARHASCAAWDVTNFAASAAEWITMELIGMHKIIENHQQSLTFFPMFLEVL